MKIVNDKGVEIPATILTEALEEMEQRFRFYTDCGHYQWEGCHCHGHNVILDRGEEAEAGLDAIRKLREKLNSDPWEEI
jgi:hypothetical protein